MKLSGLPNVCSFKLSRVAFCLHGSFYISFLDAWLPSNHDTAADVCQIVVSTQAASPHKLGGISTGTVNAGLPPLHGLGPQAQVPAGSGEGLWAGRKSVQSTPGTRFRRIPDRFPCTGTTTRSASSLPGSPPASSSLT